MIEKRNPIEQVKVVTLKSGKKLNALEIEKKIDEEKKAVEEEWVEDKKPIEDAVVLGRIHFPNNPPLYVPFIPYPQRLAKVKLN